MKILTTNKDYGKIIPNLKINGKPAPYPVVNEREIRAVAGLMFVVGFTTFFFVLFLKKIWLMSFIVPLFFIEFFIKTVFGPEWSIFGFLVKPLIRHQKPEWVGAIQKRFAWFLGLLMALAMILVFFILRIRGLLPITICATCLTLMWLESSAGICLGCKMYSFALRKKWLPEPKYRPVCPGGVCEFRSEK